MNIALIIAATSAVLAVGFTVYGYTHKTRYHWPDGAVFGAWLFAIIAVLAALMAAVITAAVSYDETVCERYAAETGRDAEFERFGFWDWDCFVDTDEGRIPTSQIVKVDD